MNCFLRCSLEAFRSFEYLRWREQFAFNGTDEFCGVTYPLPHKKNAALSRSRALRSFKDASVT